MCFLFNSNECLEKLSAYIAIILTIIQIVLCTTSWAMAFFFFETLKNYMVVNNCCR